MQSRLSMTRLGFAASLLSAATLTFAATLPAKVTLSCHFPATEMVNRVKPGQKNVSDGVIRITDDAQVLEICNKCKWANSGAKWKVTPGQFAIATPGGVEITISRADGSAVYAITAKPDEAYMGGRLESRGQCTLADKAAAKP